MPSIPPITASLELAPAFRIQRCSRAFGKGKQVILRVLRGSPWRGQGTSGMRSGSSRMEESLDTGGVEPSGSHLSLLGFARRKLCPAWQLSSWSHRLGATALLLPQIPPSSLPETPGWGTGNGRGHTWQGMDFARFPAVTLGACSSQQPLLGKFPHSPPAAYTAAGDAQMPGRRTSLGKCPAAKGTAPGLRGTELQVGEPSAGKDPFCSTACRPARQQD